MSGDEAMKSLAAEARTTLDVIRKIEHYYDEYTRSSLKRDIPSRESRIVLAEIFGNYYTALETFFLRVSQTFENNLSPARWRAALLEKKFASVRAAVHEEIERFVGVLTTRPPGSDSPNPR